MLVSLSRHPSHSLQTYFLLVLVLVLVLVVVMVIVMMVVDTEQLDVYGIVIDTLMLLLPCFY